MNEEKKAERIIEKAAAEDTGDGDKHEAASLVERAEQAVKELSAENQKREQLLEREEKLAARRALGGDSVGSGQPQPKPKEETDAEFKDKFLKGEAENPFK